MIGPYRVCRGAIWRIGLNIDALDAVPINEVIDIGAAQIGADRIVDVGLRDAERARCRLIDVQFQLRRIFQAIGPHLGQPLIAHSHAKQLVARRQQLVMAQIALVEQLEIETRRITQFLDGWRHKGDGHAGGDLLERHVRTLRDRRNRIFRAFAIRPILHASKDDADILPLPHKAEACDGEDGLHIVLFIDQIMIAHPRQ